MEQDEPGAPDLNPGLAARSTERHAHEMAHHAQPAHVREDDHLQLTIGGVGSYWGAVIGTAVLVSAQEATRFFQASASLAPSLAAARYIVMGLILILIIRFRPKGIIPEHPHIDRVAVPAVGSAGSTAAVPDPSLAE